MKGKVVLVTGANGGLGTAVVQAFLDVGAKVVGTSRKIQQSEFDSPNFTAVPAKFPIAKDVRPSSIRSSQVSAGSMCLRIP